MSESELSQRDQDPQQRLRTAIAEKVTEQLGWLNEAAEIAGGPRTLVTEVFDAPPEVRNDAPDPDWTADQTERLIAIGHRFGYGAEQTVGSGLAGGSRIAEGGKVWKMLGEAEVLVGETPTTAIFAGSPYRILGEDEHRFLHEKQPELASLFSRDATEYDFARLLAERHSDKSVVDEPIVLRFGYDISQGNPTNHEPTGQLVHIGETSNNQSVQLLRVDREIYQTEDGPKYRYQPDSARLMGFVADVLTAQGKREEPVALVTSNTYASRQVDAIRAGLQHGRQFGVAMYGRAVITGLGAPVPAAMPLNQLPGDLRSTYDKLQLLQTEL